MDPTSVVGCLVVGDVGQGFDFGFDAFSALDAKVVECVVDVARFEVGALPHEAAGGDDLVDDELAACRQPKSSSFSSRSLWTMELKISSESDIPWLLALPA